MKPTELTTLSDVQSLLVRFWDDGSKYRFSLTRYEYGHHSDFRKDKTVVYELALGRINRWTLPVDVGNALFEVWPRTKYGELRGTQTARGIAKALGVSKETGAMAKAYAVEQLEKRRQAANSSVRYILDQAVKEIGDRASLGEWTHETMIEYLKLALEGSTAGS
jgi:hypothetical protein